MTRSRDTADTQDNTGGAVPPFAAGKNKIINGDMNINQRGFTSNNGATFTFDRWKPVLVNSNTPTYSAQTFTPGAAPVANYEGANFLRIANTTNNSSTEAVIIAQYIENVRTIPSASTYTVSFWAKASSGTPKIGFELGYNYGSGGSATDYPGGQAVTLSTSWTRYSITFTSQNYTGKTIGTGSFIECNFWITAGSTYSARSGSIGNQTATIDIWGVQLEAGSVATPFQTATGTIQGELAACQRYYWRGTAVNVYGYVASPVIAANTTSAAVTYRAPVTMRTNPSSVEYANLALGDTNAVYALTNLTINRANPDFCELTATVASGLTQYRPYFLCGNNNAAGYLGISAEL